MSAGAADDRPIVLIGFMGSGKSAVGRRVAERLGWEFVDSDREVEERAGRSVARIFAERGEACFRELERESLLGLASRRRVVVAAGGGGFLDAVVRRRLLRETRTVWLDVPLAVAEARVGAGDERPLWAADDPVRLRALYERRRAGYALACNRIDAATDPARVAEAVLTVLR